MNKIIPIASWNTALFCWIILNAFDKICFFWWASNVRFWNSRFKLLQMIAWLLSSIFCIFSMTSKAAKWPCSWTIFRQSSRISWHLSRTLKKNSERCPVCSHSSSSRSSSAVSEWFSRNSFIMLHLLSIEAFLSLRFAVFWTKSTLLCFTVSICLERFVQVEFIFTQSSSNFWTMLLILKVLFSTVCVEFDVDFIYASKHSLFRTLSNIPCSAVTRTFPAYCAVFCLHLIPSSCLLQVVWEIRRFSNNPENYQAFIYIFPIFLTLSKYSFFAHALVTFSRSGLTADEVLSITDIFPRGKLSEFLIFRQINCRRGPTTLRNYGIALCLAQRRHRPPSKNHSNHARALSFPLLFRSSSHVSRQNLANFCIFRC